MKGKDIIQKFHSPPREATGVSLEEKLITHHRPMGPNHLFHLPIDPCAIATNAELMMKFWCLSQTDSRTCRPMLSFLKPEGELVELWLAKISL